MACNCGKKSGAAQARTVSTTSTTSGTTQSFALISRDSSKQIFGSRLEADAANARQGYTGVVKPVAS